MSGYEPWNFYSSTPGMSYPYFINDGFVSSQQQQPPQALEPPYFDTYIAYITQPSTSIIQQPQLYPPHQVVDQGIHQRTVFPPRVTQELHEISKVPSGWACICGRRFSRQDRARAHVARETQVYQYPCEGSKGHSKWCAALLHKIRPYSDLAILAPSLLFPSRQGERIITGRRTLVPTGMWTKMPHSSPWLTLEPSGKVILKRNLLRHRKGCHPRH